MFAPKAKYNSSAWLTLVDGDPWRREVRTEFLDLRGDTLDHPAALPLYQKMGFEPVSQNQAIIRPLADEEILALMKAESVTPG